MFIDWLIRCHQTLEKLTYVIWTERYLIDSYYLILSWFLIIYSLNVQDLHEVFLMMVFWERALIVDNCLTVVMLLCKFNNYFMIYGLCLVQFRFHLVSWLKLGLLSGLLGTVFAFLETSTAISRRSLESLESLESLSFTRDTENRSLLAILKKTK